MLKVISLVAASALLTACFGSNVKDGESVLYSKPQDINLVIIHQDKDDDDLNKSSNAAYEIKIQLSQSISKLGYTVFDINDVADGDFEEENADFDELELMDYFSDRPKPRMDALVPFSVYYHIDHDNDRLRVGLKAKVLDVNAHAALGRIDIPGPFIKLPKNCRGMCVQDLIPHYAEKLVKKLSQSLDYKLGQMLHESYRSDRQRGDGQDSGHRSPVERHQGIIFEDARDANHRRNDNYERGQDNDQVVERVDSRDSRVDDTHAREKPVTTKRVDGIFMEGQSESSQDSQKMRW
jgi:hypothetical protein